MSKEFWVFGYGSLMWKPGFPFVERCVAELAHHRRSFCLKSVRYRGTEEYPGLVLALEPKRDAVCRGVAYRVSASDAVETRAYLQDREMDRGSYFEQFQRLRLADERNVDAICYVINPNNPDYLHHLTFEEKAHIIATAVGPTGTNRDYLFNTLRDLQEMSLDDAEVEQLSERVRFLLEQNANP